MINVSDFLMVIIAADEDKGMSSKYPKVMHTVCGKPMIQWIYNASLDAEIKKHIVITGQKGEEIKNYMGETALYVSCKEHRGSGYALMQAYKYIEAWKGHILALCGNTPLIVGKTISDASHYHIENNNEATAISAATDSGIYYFKKESLVKVLEIMEDINNHDEYTLKDIYEAIASQGDRTGVFKVCNAQEVLQVNDRLGLSAVSGILYRNICDRHMKAGVTIINPGSTYIEDDVKIGADTVIYPGSYLEGNTVIGEDCIIGPDSVIKNSIIGNRVEITKSTLVESSAGDDTKIGPYAYIRPESSIGRKVKIGDFVEIKKSKVGDGTKIPHHAYIGDSEVGRNTNVGCGAITANYDGKNKHKTIIGNNVSVGSNVNLVAPVVVRDDSYIASGSTITDEVPEYSLAIARSRQVIKENWVLQKGMKRQEK
jgi:bifunctional UDP-N-acetylglucosamine pyrophosphorylase / glucosamine-1-phosphate N-acetyltransferase